MEPMKVENELKRRKNLLIEDFHEIFEFLEWRRADNTSSDASENFGALEIDLINFQLLIDELSQNFEAFKCRSEAPWDMKTILSVLSSHRRS